MKSKLLLLIAFPMMFLLIGKVRSQNPYQYQFVLIHDGEPVNDNWLSTEEESGCYFPQMVYWPRDVLLEYLHSRGYDIRVRKPDGSLTFYWLYDLSCSTTQVTDIDQCTDLYERVITISNAHPDYNPNNTGPLPIYIHQYIRFSMTAAPTEQAGQYLPTITVNPGTDIYVAWWNMPANNTAALRNYINGFGFEIPGDEGCWQNMSISYGTPEEVPLESSCESGNCYKTFRMTYNFLNLPCGGGFQYYQYVRMPAPVFSVNTNEMGPIEISGCGEVSAPNALTRLSEFERFGVVFSNVSCEKSMTISHFDREETQPDGSVNVLRTYWITDECTNHTEILDQLITTHPYFEVLGSGQLQTLYYEEDGAFPAPYDRITHLTDKGFRYYGCDVPSVLLDDEYDEDYPPDHPDHVRVYKVYYEKFPDYYGYATQRIEYRPSTASPMTVYETAANCDAGGYGKVEILMSDADRGCPTCNDNDQLWYIMEYVNHSENEVVVVDAHTGSSNVSNPDVNIWENDHLKPGDYTLNVYVSCSEYPEATEPIWKKDFTIQGENQNTDKIVVLAVNNAWTSAQYVTGNPNGDGQTWFYNTKTLLPWVHEVCGYSEGAGEEWDDTRDDPHKKISYTWKGDGVAKGYPKDKYSMIGMTEGEYNTASFTQYYHWAPEFKERMGHLLFDGRMWEYTLKNRRNDMRVIVEYESDDQTKSEFIDFTVYFACLISSLDPNEIYGPEGYDTTAHFINATDPITYTINYENDPELATGAASLVMITCPLDDKGVVNTFRLGNFGFGDYTFEVSSMASQYSQRFDLADSLGVWLDVTAGVMVPDNYAYWIFQSIDPATGLPPTGNLGFLPVNDSLNPGNGQGYVTFTINPQPGIVTGDEITEQAFIVFDQNDTVPTNTYTNRFDAIPPSSTLVGDTTGVGVTGVLNLSFTAADDTDGSGVAYINLYVNIDNTDYEFVGMVLPDSVYQYRMELGSQFDFIGRAVDHVNNMEAFKTAPEFTYVRGTAPTDIRLSASTFDEDAPLFTVIGNFSTTDDQTSNMFVYSLVDGDGADHNALFDIVGNALVTDNDFRCYGLYDYSIRVRSLDLSNQYIEKVFTVHAMRTMTPEVVTLREYLCPNQTYYFGGEWIGAGGIYYDTLQTAFGCDSIVCLVLENAAEPLVTEIVDTICFGSDYADHGYNLTADTLVLLTAGWTMSEDIVLSLDRYSENYYGCYDTTRLALTIHPAFNYVDAVSVCQIDLPYQYQGVPFYRDTVAVFSYQTGLGCDSVYTLNLSVKQQLDQSNDLANGWNWFSTFVDQSDGEGLTNLEEALNGNGQMIKSKTAFVTYDPDYNMWFGNLEAINNTSMFMVKMRDPQVARLTGCPADIDTVMLASGWTWIGYPLTDTTSVNQLTPAIVGAPTNDDVIKSKQSFAMYNAEYGIWFGSLDDMTPGVGYMYLSNANSVKPLYYGNRQRTGDVQPLDIPATHWNADDKPFANNMTMMGLISLDGQIIHSDTLEVGAFVNNEQRGSGRAVYIEQMDAYRIFLTVHGEDGETVSFRLFNHSRNKERRIRCDEQLTFMADRHFGTLDNPYVFAFETSYDKYIQAEICEGEYYTDHNFRVFKAGTYFMELTTAQGNDSIVRLDLTVNPVYHVEEEVVAVEFPFEYEGVVFDRPGTFVLPFQTAAACDSVWEVTVTPYEGLRELLISPQPASRTQRVSLYYPFTQAEQRGVVVEVYTIGGSLLQSKRPTRFPIELDPFPTDGTYMVKITLGTGEVLSGKIIIR